MDKSCINYLYFLLYDPLIKTIVDYDSNEFFHFNYFLFIIHFIKFLKFLIFLNKNIQKKSPIKLFKIIFSCLNPSM